MPCPIAQGKALSMRCHDVQVMSEDTETEHGIIWISRCLIFAMMLNTFPQGLGGSGRVDFNREVRPILFANCFTCQVPGENERRLLELWTDEQQQLKADLLQQHLELTDVHGNV